LSRNACPEAKAKAKVKVKVKEKEVLRSRKNTLFADQKFFSVSGMGFGQQPVDGGLTFVRQIQYTSN